VSKLVRPSLYAAEYSPTTFSVVTSRPRVIFRVLFSVRMRLLPFFPQGLAHLFLLQCFPLPSLLRLSLAFNGLRYRLIGFLLPLSLSEVRPQILFVTLLSLLLLILLMWFLWYRAVWNSFLPVCYLPTYLLVPTFSRIISFAFSWSV